MNTYFLHFNTLNLSFYFEKGLICPANFYSKNRKKDLQSEFENQLLLSKLKKLPADCDCSLEIIVSDEEKNEIEQSANETEDYFLTDKTFPITRVKKIYENSSSQIISDPIIPKHLLESCSDNAEKDTEPSLPKEIANEQNKDLKQKIEKYDSFLGALAFLRLGGKTPMNYSPNYFSILSFLNVFIGEEYENLASEKIKPEYKNAFDFSGRWQYFSDFMHSDEVKIKTEIEKLSKTIELPYGIYNLKKDGDEDGKIYILKIMYNYFFSKRKDTNDLFTDISNEKFSEKFLESICFFIGYLEGYSNLKMNYLFQGNENSKRTVKFLLDSKLDYYTIESVYQYIFNGKKENSRFGFIDNLDFLATLKPVYDPSNKIDFSNYETFEILGKIVILSEKSVKPAENILETILEKLQKLIKKWLPDFYENIEVLIKNELIKIVEPVIKKSIEEKTELNQKLEKSEKEKTELKEKLEEVGKEKTELNQKLVEVGKENTELNQKLEEVGKEKTEKDQKLEKSEKEKTELKEKLEEVGKEKTELNQKLEKSEKEKTELKEKLEEVGKEKTEKDQKLEEVDKEKSNLDSKNDLQLLKYTKEELEKFDEKKIDKMIKEHNNKVKKLSITGYTKTEKTKKIEAILEKSNSIQCSLTI